MQQQLAPPSDVQRTGLLMAIVGNPTFFNSGYPFPWSPPGSEFWTALLEARKARKPLERKNDGPPNKNAPKSEWIREEIVNRQTGEVSFQVVPPPVFTYVSADEYIAECERVCLPAGIVVVPSTTIQTTVEGTTISRTLNASYYVAHATSGQGLVLRCDVPIGAAGGMGDPTKKAYTISWSLFVRGFLAIPGTDEGQAAPEQSDQEEQHTQAQSGPPQGYTPQGYPQQQGYPLPPHAYPSHGPPPDHGPGGYPQRQPYQPAQQQQVPQHFPGGPQGYPQPGSYGGGPGGPGHAPQQTQGGYGYTGGGPAGRGPNGMVGHPGHGQVPSQGSQGQRGQRPMNRMQNVHNDPTVQAAATMLDARPGRPRDESGEDEDPNAPPVRMRRPAPAAPSAPSVQTPPRQPQGPPVQVREPDLSAPPAPYTAEPIRGSVAGDPQTVEQWVEALLAKGWDEDVASSLAAHRPDEPIGEALKAEILSIAFGYFDKNGEAVRAAFEGTGFVPMPNLPDQLKPKPTGLQLLRFAVKLDLNTKKSPHPDSE